jgi:hypothetical protein
MGMPPPYNPMTGQFAPLVQPGEYPYCALVQIAEEDTHDDYVVCRGYDPRTKTFWLYDESDETKNGFSVAKPYSNRRPGQYQVGHIFPALLPLCQRGQTPGVAATSQGQPADLDEEIEILYSDEGKVINWLLLDTGQANVFGKLKAALAYNATDPSGVDVDVYSDPSTDAGYDIEDVLPPPWMTTGTLASGSWVEVKPWGGKYYASEHSSPTHVWGKLDADLDYDETGGVAVSIWNSTWTADTSQNITGVLPPPTMTEGTIPSGSWVRVAFRDDGTPYVDMAPC